MRSRTLAPTDARSSWRYRKGGDARIVLCRPTGTARLGIGVHAAELVEFENLAVFANTSSRVDDAARRFGFDFRRDNRHGDRKHDQSSSTRHDVERALGETVRTAPLDVQLGLQALGRRGEGVDRFRVVKRGFKPRSFDAGLDLALGVCRQIVVYRRRSSYGIVSFVSQLFLIRASRSSFARASLSPDMPGACGGRSSRSSLDGP